MSLFTGIIAKTLAADVDTSAAAKLERLVVSAINRGKTSLTTNPYVLFGTTEYSVSDVKELINSLKLAGYKASYDSDEGTFYLNYANGTVAKIVEIDAGDTTGWTTAVNGGSAIIGVKVTDTTTAYVLTGDISNSTVVIYNPDGAATITYPEGAEYYITSAEYEARIAELTETLTASTQVVTTQAALSAALNNDFCEVISIEEDLVLSGGITIQDEIQKEIVVDGTLTLGGNIVIEDDVDLTLSGSGTISGQSVSTTKNLISVGDGCNLVVEDLTLETSGYGIGFGEGAGDVTLTNVTIDSVSPCVGGNATYGAGGTLTIDGGHLSAYETDAIYWPIDGDIVITGEAVVEGIQMRGGSLTIGEDAEVKTAAWNSGTDSIGEYFNYSGHAWLNENGEAISVVSGQSGYNYTEGSISGGANANGITVYCVDTNTTIEGITWTIDEDVDIYTNDMIAEAATTAGKTYNPVSGLTVITSTDN